MPEVIGVVLFLEFLVLLAMFVISDFYGAGTGHGSDSINGHLGNCYEKSCRQQAALRAAFECMANMLDIHAGLPTLQI